MSAARTDVKQLSIFDARKRSTSDTNCSNIEGSHVDSMAADLGRFDLGSTITDSRNVRRGATDFKKDTVGDSQNIIAAATPAAGPEALSESDAFASHLCP